MEEYHSFKVGTASVLSSLFVTGKCSMGKPSRLDECEKQKK
jgi:hypothetical protein